MRDDREESTRDQVPVEPGSSGEEAKDPAEQEALAKVLGEELTDLFARFVRGEAEFSEVAFLTFETLQDLHVIASGAYELEYDDDERDEGYDEEEATEQQEDLAQEPASR